MLPTASPDATVFDEVAAPVIQQHRRLLMACINTNLQKLIRGQQQSTRSLLSQVQGLVESAPRVFCIADANVSDYPLVFVSQGFKDVIGYDTTDMVGKTCKTLQGYVPQKHG